MSVIIHITLNEKKDGLMETKYDAYADMATKREINIANVMSETIRNKLNQIEIPVLLERIVREC